MTISSSLILIVCLLSLPRAAKWNKHSAMYRIPLCRFNVYMYIKRHIAQVK